MASSSGRWLVVAAGMAAAVADEVFDADLVAVHARRATTGRAATPPIALPTTASDRRPPIRGPPRRWPVTTNS